MRIPARQQVQAQARIERQESSIVPRQPRHEPLPLGEISQIEDERRDLRELVKMSNVPAAQKILSTLLRVPKGKGRMPRKRAGSGGDRGAIAATAGAVVGVGLRSKGAPRWLRRRLHRRKPMLEQGIFCPGRAGATIGAFHECGAVAVLTDHRCYQDGLCSTA